MFNQTHEFHGLPNQMLISLLLLSLREKEKESTVNRVKLISQEKNICVLLRLEIQKAMGNEWESESYKSTNVPRMEM